MSSEKRLKITFYDGAGGVTGSNFLIEEEGGLKILLDCGLIQGSDVCEKRNREPFGYNPAEIDILFVSHGHLDHVGRIPKLVKDGFRGKIYSTPPTREIAELIMTDSMGVLGKEALRDNLPPIYEEEDVVLAVSLWSTLEYGKVLELGSFRVSFLNSGHILGSSMVKIEHHGRKIVYTSDLGNSPSPFLPDVEKLDDVDYLITETVYGDKNHQSREIGTDLLEDSIEDVVKSGGVLMIPAFSIERTQEILFQLKKMMEESRIPLVKVYLDSPLAIKVTDIYLKYSDYYKEGTEETVNITTHGLFAFPQLMKTPTTDESKSINKASTPKVIIAGSGMSNGGRIIHHERLYLPDKKNVLLLTGYQASRSLGRRLQDGAKSVYILGEKVPVRAKVVTISGYSAHMGSDELFNFVAHASDSLKKVFAIQGEPKSSFYFVQKIRDNLAVDAVSPEYGSSFYLD